ncbi:MAG: efflux RND transporter periplasmic adaptor subunit [Gammaproteobacteria bacterium]|nr:efflux RND transporter periplasmic adaptor subunit [Gammaproteobacteria bacterium]
MNMIRLTTLLATLAVAAPGLAAVPFETATVGFVDAARERIWDGRVEAVNQATVSAQTSGRIAELPFDVNDYVDAGDIVMRFTDTEQKAALSRAEATLQEARARLAEARQEFERFSKMIENNSISRSQFDQARANRDAAEARLNAAISGVETAKEQLEYTVVRAPYAGIVSRRHVQLGEVVSPGQPLISGLSLHQLRVNVDVPQSMFHAIRTIGKAYAYVEDERIEAASLTFFPVADAGSNTFRVRVNLPDGAATLYPGMFIKVGFVVGETKRLLVPVDAVVRRSELSAVYVVDGDTVSLRQVRLGRRYGDSIEILAGLTEGEVVATDPVRAGIWLKEQAIEQ